SKAWRSRTWPRSWPPRSSSPWSATSPGRRQRRPEVELGRRLPPRGEDDAGASFRVREGLVVAQGDAEETAHVRQARGEEPPGGAREPHRADEGKVGRLESGSPAAGLEDAAVESGVVSGEEGRALEEFSHRRQTAAKLGASCRSSQRRPWM